MPTAAVRRGPIGTFVYVVEQNNAAAVRPVTVAKQDETQSVISRGLQAGERVVTTGFARLTVGTKVNVTNAEDVPASHPHAWPPRRGGKVVVKAARQREGSQRGNRPNAPAGPSQ